MIAGPLLIAQLEQALIDSKKPMAARILRMADARQLMRMLGDIRQSTARAEQSRLLVDGLCSLVDADAGWFVELQKDAGRWTPVDFAIGSAPDTRLSRYVAQFGREEEKGSSLNSKE